MRFREEKTGISFLPPAEPSYHQQNPFHPFHPPFQQISFKILAPPFNCAHTEPHRWGMSVSEGESEYEGEGHRACGANEGAPHSPAYECSFCEEVQKECKESVLRLQRNFEYYAERQNDIIRSLLNDVPSSTTGECDAEELESLRAENEQLRKVLASEEQRRKTLHNEVQDLKGKIRVFVRLRPLTPKEIVSGCEEVFHADGSVSLMSLPDESKRQPSKFWDFDGIFRGDHGQTKVFEEVKHLVTSAVDGHNVCLFAYGQTGSGKTFTMFGGAQKDQNGIAPRAARELFAVLDGRKATTEFSISTSILELHNDQLQDLLAPRSSGGSAEGVTLRYNEGTFELENAVSRGSNDLTELLDLITFGCKKRSTSSTKMNEDSSRSHLIVTLTLQSKNRYTGKAVKSKLSIVDLAGSERLSKCGEVGRDQLRETKSINKSLSCLGDVIRSLTSGSKHIPYRNHPLTMLMSDSLQGSSKTIMFVCCSPADYNRGETCSSLDFARRCKNVVCQNPPRLAAAAGKENESSKNASRER